MTSLSGCHSGQLLFAVAFVKVPAAPGDFPSAWTPSWMSASLLSHPIIIIIIMSKMGLMIESTPQRCWGDYQDDASEVLSTRA